MDSIINISLFGQLFANSFKLFEQYFTINSLRDCPGIEAERFVAAKPALSLPDPGQPATPARAS